MTVYRAGVAIDRPVADSGGSVHSLRPPLVVKRWRELFPRRQFVDLVHVAFARVERLNSPPRGQPFFVHGKPYATDEEFIDDLCEELREQLRCYLEETRKALS